MYTMILKDKVLAASHGSKCSWAGRETDLHNAHRIQLRKMAAGSRQSVGGNYGFRFGEKTSGPPATHSRGQRKWPFTGSRQDSIRQFHTKGPGAIIGSRGGFFGSDQEGNRTSFNNQVTTGTVISVIIKRHTCRLTVECKQSNWAPNMTVTASYL